MWYDIFTSELLFKVSLFSLLLYKVTYWVRNYIHPFLKTYLSSEKKHLIEIVEKEQLLTATRQKIESQLFNQKQLFTLLEKNVQSWHKMLHDQALEKEEHLKAQHTKFIQKQNVVLTQKNFEFAAAYVIPAALQQAQMRLYENYAHENGAKLLNKIVDTLPNASPNQYERKS